MKSFYLLLTIACAFCAISINATTIHVPSGQPTIQAGIDAASYGDTVEVACGTYYEHGIEMKSGICLRSETGEAECVTVDANSLGRVFYCEGVQGSVIKGFTIVGGYAHKFDNEAGGGMECRGSSLALDNCVFANNVALSGGGGIYSHFSSLDIVNCVFNDNLCGGYGGGVSRFGSDAASPSITNCVFSGNVSQGFGGGVYSDDFGYSGLPLIVTHSVFKYNTADYGGGMACIYSAARVTNCTFFGNSAVSGGAVASGNPILTGLYVPVFDKCIIAASASGEGVYCMDGDLVTLRCCNVFDNEGGDWVGCISNQAEINDNFSADPMFCDTGAGNFEIAGNSPCAPANSPCGKLVGADSVGCVETDVRDLDTQSGLPLGFTLSQNYPNPFNPVTNIDFALPRAAHVRIEVFNILGSRVSTLVDEYLSAGYKSVEWDGRSNSGQAVSSGVYLFRITAGEFSASRKAVLMK